MLTIAFVRHSIATDEPGDPGLSPEGHDLAQRAALRLRELGVGRIVSSPLRRSRETAGIFGRELRIPVEVDTRLRERDNWGDVPGESRAAFVDRWIRCDNDRDHVPEHGRSARQAGRDVDAFVREVSHAPDRGVVLVVAHGGVIVDFLLNTHTASRLSALTPGYRDMPHCALTLIDADLSGYTLERLAESLA